MSEKSGNRKIDSRSQVLAGLSAAPKGTVLTVTPSPVNQGAEVDLFPDVADIPETEVVDDSINQPVFPTEDWDNANAPHSNHLHLSTIMVLQSLTWTMVPNKQQEPNNPL